MKKSYSILCLASLLLASCSQEQDNQLSSQEKPVYLQVEVEPLSRATLLKDLPSDCEYGIYCNDKTSKVEYHNGKSTIVDPIALDKKNQRVFAYYPWSEEKDMWALEEQVVLFNAMDDIDNLWGQSYYEVNLTSPKANIVFNHVFSRIGFEIKPNQYLEEALKQELVLDYITVGEIPINRYMSTYGKSFSDQYETVYLKCGKSLADGNISLSTFCAPNVDNDTYYLPDWIYIKLYFQGKEEPAVIKIAKNNWKLEAGKKYTRYITINGRLEAELSETVTVRPWNEGGSQDFIVK